MGVLCQAPSMHCSLQNRKQDGVVEEGQSPNSWQLEGLDNKTTSEQTGLTAGPGSAREAVKNHKTEGGEWGKAGWGNVGREVWNSDFSLRRDWGMETAPYSRSSSSYNSLYLPLLNLKEKTWIWGCAENLSGLMTRKERRKEYLNEWHEDRLKRKKKKKRKKNMEDNEKEGKKKRLKETGGQKTY